MARASRQGETTMPGPDGCFVQVWDLGRFGGVMDYMRLALDREYQTFPDELSGRIASMRIDCPLTTPRNAE
jgi:hypothetical protein